MIVRVEGVPPWDGDYQLDLGRLTNRELHRIREISGVRAGELDESMQALDNGVIVALSAIALERDGKRGALEDLWGAEFGAISFHDEPEEQDAADVADPLEPPVSDESDGTDNGSSGSSSRTDGE